MADVVQGRVTDAHEGAVVVFLIGMRVNKPWRVRQWAPVLAAMPRMLRELASDPTSGLLGHHLALGANGPMVVQYWRSTDELVAYAQAADREHRPAWQRFNAAARAGGAAVGIWHETYAVEAGAHESLYVGMPPSGLAAATGHVPVARRGETARERLAG